MHPEPFEDSRRLTGCNVYFAATGAALETARGWEHDDAATDRWRANIATVREALGWTQADIVIHRHRTGASLAFAAPMDQLYTATEVNEWAWWSALLNFDSAVSFSPRGKVPEGRMREGAPSSSATSRKKLPFDPETQDFIRQLRKNTTEPEQLLWGFLRDRRLHNQKFRRQKSLGPYILDFYCHELKLAIELDGGQHNESAHLASDTKRDAFVASQGVMTLRYWNHDVLARTDDVLADIWERVHALVKGDTDDGTSIPSSGLRPPSPGGRREQKLELFHAPGHAAVWDTDVAIHTLASVAKAEARPELIALQEQANAHGLPLLADDDEVSIGEGTGSRTWFAEGLPSPVVVPWAHLHTIPTALVTGSNGKTTTVRLLAAMATAHGWRTAYSCTDGVFFDGKALETGDFSGPTGTRTALRQDGAEAAILETARGGMLRRGLALCHANVAIVTNIAADHFGEYGVHGLDDLARVKLTVARAIRHDGRLVLNADDPTLVAHAHALAVPLAWFASDFDHPLLLQHRAQAGATCGVRDGRLLLHVDGVGNDLGAVASMPLTVQGRATYNIANLAGAALTASALGIPAVTIANIAARFGSEHDDNPGRLQRWRFGDLQVYIDYAHNPDGLRGLLEVALADASTTRRFALLLGQAGNREDDDIRELVATATAFHPDHVVLKDIGEGYMRGRAPGEIAALMRSSLVSFGMPESAIVTCLDEAEAARQALAWARQDDVVVLPLHEPTARTQAVKLLEQMEAAGWRPGMAVPPLPAADA
jgi:UDP-N-acetylmuramyl tripeptide synthase/very-short-patch-repair endonuclease